MNKFLGRDGKINATRGNKNMKNMDADKKRLKEISNNIELSLTEMESWKLVYGLVN